MILMTSAPSAVLLQFQPIGVMELVLGGCIVAAFARTASQGYDEPGFLLGHLDVLLDFSARRWRLDDNLLR